MEIRTLVQGTPQCPPCAHSSSSLGLFGSSSGSGAYKSPSVTSPSNVGYGASVGKRAPAERRRQAVGGGGGGVVVGVKCGSCDSFAAAPLPSPPCTFHSVRDTHEAARHAWHVPLDEEEVALRVDLSAGVGRRSSAERVFYFYFGRRVQGLTGSALRAVRAHRATAAGRTL